MRNTNTVPGRLPPTTEALLDYTTRPYFLWWTAATVGQLKEHLASADPEERAYWMGALLREANTRDVWLFFTTDEICALWPPDPLSGALPPDVGLAAEAPAPRVAAAEPSSPSL